MASCTTAVNDAVYRYMVGDCLVFIFLVFALFTAWVLVTAGDTK